MTIAQVPLREAGSYGDCIIDLADGMIQNDYPLDIKRQRNLPKASGCADKALHISIRPPSFAYLKNTELNGLLAKYLRSKLYTQAT